jgi:anaphase-promoting complex subunit 4
MLTPIQGIGKWESTVSEALIKLRDYAEKRLAPALQRLILVLEETLIPARFNLYACVKIFLGWKSLSNNRPNHKFVVGESNMLAAQSAILLASQGVFLAGWLAAVARRELFRFEEFISWIKWGTQI